MNRNEKWFSWPKRYTIHIVCKFMFPDFDIKIPDTWCLTPKIGHRDWRRVGWNICWWKSMKFVCEFYTAGIEWISFNVPRLRNFLDISDLSELRIFLIVVLGTIGNFHNLLHEFRLWKSPKLQNFFLSENLKTVEIW